MENRIEIERIGEQQDSCLDTRMIVTREEVERIAAKENTTDSLIVFRANTDDDHLKMEFAARASDYVRAKLCIELFNRLSKPAQMLAAHEMLEDRK